MTDIGVKSKVPSTKVTTFVDLVQELKNLHSAHEIISPVIIVNCRVTHEIVNYIQ